MKIVKICTTLAIFASLSGCASMMYGDKLVTDETRNTRVIDAAAFDLNCDKSNIEVSKINDTSYAAKGCSKKARYTLDKCHDMNWKTVCTAIANGAVQDI